MKTIYSVQNYRTSIVRDLIFLILGVVLIIFQSDVAIGIVRFLGAAIIVVSIVSAIRILRVKMESGKGIVWAGIAIGFLFGLFILFFPDIFTEYVAILLGLLLIWGGALQLVTLIRALKWTSFNFVSFFFPLVSIALGVATVIKTKAMLDSLMWLVGIFMIFYALTDAITQYQMYKMYGKMEVQAPDDADGDVVKLESGEIVIEDHHDSHHINHDEEPK